ncbi:GlsB/YeaQ/YmgE family stress response membrane protein [Enterobacter ludwigii]
MTLLFWIAIGLVAGWLKRVFFPGRPGGFVPTLMLAVIGALIGGYIATYFTTGDLAAWHPAGFATALLGALLMLLVAAKLRI